MQVPIALPAWLPLTALVAILVFVVREILEWRRRSAADKRKVKALKRIIARECRENNWAITVQLKVCRGLVAALWEQDPKRVQFGPREGGDLFALIREDDKASIGFAIRPVARTALLKHLPEVAALDDELFEQCEKAIDGLSPAEWIPSVLERIKVEGPDTPPDLNSRSVVQFYVKQLEEVDSLNRALYEACVGQKLPVDPHAVAPS